MNGEGDSDSLTPFLDLGEFCNITVVMASLFGRWLSLSFPRKRVEDSPRVYDP